MRDSGALYNLCSCFCCSYYPSSSFRVVFVPCQLNWSSSPSSSNLELMMIKRKLLLLVVRLAVPAATAVYPAAAVCCLLLCLSVTSPSHSLHTHVPYLLSLSLHTHVPPSSSLPQSSSPPLPPHTQLSSFSLPLCACSKQQSKGITISVLGFKIIS